MVTRWAFLLLLSAVRLSYGQAIETSNPYYVGHSLVNFDMPALVQRLAESGAKNSEYAVQVINGASIQSNYTNWNFAQGSPYTTALPTAKYDAFIITEAVPLLNHTTWSDTYNAANNFLTYARTHQPDIRYFIYETWHCTNTGRTDTVIPEIAPRKCWYDNDDNLLWAPRLLNDFPKWAKIVDSVRSLQNYDQVYMVPAGQAFYELHNAIERGELPEYTSFRQLFSDDIHLTLEGNYFVACVMYACIFRSSPEGLTNKINDEWGNPWLDLPESVAYKMQQIAWETVCGNTYSGVNCLLTSSNKSNNGNQTQVSVYPQPTFDKLHFTFQNANIKRYALINQLGQIVAYGTTAGLEDEIDLKDLPSGPYILTVNQEGFKEEQVRVIVSKY